MNKALITGRLTRDPNVRYTTTGDKSMAIARFTLAVDRRRSRGQEGNGQTADFISCVAFGKTGEFVEKYAHKGQKFDICGHIQTGSYQNKDGQTVYTTDIVVDEIEFGETKGSGSNSAPQQAQQHQAPAGDAANQPMADGLGDGFMNVPDEIEDELPFN